MKRQEKLPFDNSQVSDVIELLRVLLHDILTASVPAWLDLQLTLPQLRTVFIIAHNKTSSVIKIAKQLRIGEPTPVISLISWYMKG